MKKIFGGQTSKDNHDGSNEMPLQGVSLKYIQKWCKENSVGQEETAHDIIKRVKAMCDGSFCDALLQIKPSARKEKAEYFVSHAWSYRFLNLIDALENHRRKDKKKDLFVWIDLFVVNQHNAANQEYDFEWWQNTFHQGINEMGHTLLVLSPWDNPIPLTRCWCIWEIYGAIKYDSSRFEICMSEQEEAAFENTLIKDFERLVTVASEIDGEKAEASNPEDKKRIFEVIHNTIGFDEINEKVREPIRKWLTKLITTKP